DARKKGFTEHVPGQKQGFRDRLGQAFLDQIGEDERRLVSARGAAGPREHIQEIMNLALGCVASLFGRVAQVPTPEGMMVTEPGDNNGRIHDEYEYFEML